MTFARRSWDRTTFCVLVGDNYSGRENPGRKEHRFGRVGLTRTEPTLSLDEPIAAAHSEQRVNSERVTLLSLLAWPSRRSAALRPRWGKKIAAFVPKMLVK
jgi:hypothetical protein